MDTKVDEFIENGFMPLFDLLTKTINDLQLSKALGVPKINGQSIELLHGDIFIKPGSMKVNSDDKVLEIPCWKIYRNYKKLIDGVVVDSDICEVGRNGSVLTTTEIVIWVAMKASIEKHFEGRESPLPPIF